MRQLDVVGGCLLGGFFGKLHWRPLFSLYGFSSGVSLPLPVCMGDG
jgi:hypothetical protein